jgi:hypothetical protein
MRDLRAFRRVDGQPTIRNPRFLETGQSWTTPLDVSDYYDMTKPGTYQVTVTREVQYRYHPCTPENWRAVFPGCREAQAQIRFRPCSGESRRCAATMASGEVGKHFKRRDQGTHVLVVYGDVRFIRFSKRRPARDER